MIVLLAKKNSDLSHVNDGNLIKYVEGLLLHLKIMIKGPPLNGVTLGQLKGDNINRMIQLTDVFLCTILV